MQVGQSIRMVRSFMDWAVGPLASGRVGAVLGFVGGIVLLLVGRWIAGFPDDMSFNPLFAVYVVGPVCALVGSLLGRLLAPRRPPPMPRTFMEWAVGPLTPGRIGAVFGVLIAWFLGVVGYWIDEGEIDHSHVFVALFFGGPPGALCGAIVGVLIARRKRPLPPTP